MKREEIKKAIRAKEKELNEKRNALAGSQDKEEVRSLGEDCQKIIDELEALKDQLEALDENGDGEEAGRSTKFNPMSTYGARSFTMNGAGVAVASENETALKRGESFAQRFNIDRKGLDLGKYIRGIATGNWNGADQERSAMNTGAMGAIIPAELSAKVIDYARNKSLFATAGVPIYPMNSNSLTVARVSKDPVFKFKKEGAEGQQVNFELEGVKLEAKTAYGYAYITLEALNSAENLTDILNKVFSQAIANAIDTGILYGQENDTDKVAPAGIMNDESINEIEATNKGYNDFIRAIGSVRKNNGDPAIMAINADTEEKLSLFHDDNFVYREAPEAVKKLQQIVTNQLAHDDDTGANDALVFDPEAIAIGLQNNITVRMITDSDECIKKGLVGFQLYAMLDGKATQPKHITKVTGYTGEEESASA